MILKITPQPVMFHNLNHELIFGLESACLVIASFSYSCAWAFHYQGKDMGELQPNKLASLGATLVRNSAHPLNHSLTDRGKV